MFHLVAVSALILISALVYRCLAGPRAARAPRPRPVFYLLGNIGAGKSLLARNVAAACPDFVVLPEPVDVWQSLEDHNVLALFGACRSTWAFAFQTLVFSTFARRARDAPDDRVVVFERSPGCALYLFAQDMANAGTLLPAHMAILRHLYATLFPPSSRHACYLYVRVDAETAFARARGRGRVEEQTLPFVYFARLHRLLEAWLLRNHQQRVRILDGQLPPGQLLEATLQAIRQELAVFN